MRKLAIAALAATMTLALAGAPAAAGKGRNQVEEGSIALAAPFDSSQCFFGLHRRARLMTLQAFPNGVVGYDFEVDPKTVGRKFVLEVTGGSDDVDIDLSFYQGLGDPSDPGGAPANVDFHTREPGGEIGKVPEGFDTVILCMFAGSNAEFRYEAGKGVKFPEGS